MDIEVPALMSSFTLTWLRQFRTEVEVSLTVTNFKYENKDLVNETYSLLKSIRWFHAFQNHCELQDIMFTNARFFPRHIIKKI